MLEILVEHADRDSLILTPPTIETVGQLPECLYRPQRAFASPLAQQLAWGAVLRQAGRLDLQRIIAAPPAGDDSISWWELGQMTSRLHTELAADELNFSDVARQAQHLDAVGEPPFLWSKNVDCEPVGGDILCGGEEV